MTNGTPAGKRQGWRAAALGLAMPGLGQVAVDQPVKGLSIFGIFFGVFTIGLRLAVQLPEMLLIAGVGTTLLAVVVIYLLAAADAWRVAGRGGDRAPSPWNRWYSLLAVWLLGGVIGTGAVYDHARSSSVEAFKIPSSSMEPTVLKGDRLFVDKTAYRRMPPRVGDVVVFVAPDDRSKIFIKRIAALPGDVAAGADGRPELVPHGMAFLIGDNAGGSLDSRAFGFVPLRDLLGKARQIYWSRGPDGIRWGRIGVIL